MIRIELQGAREALKGLKKYQNPERRKLLNKAMKAAAKYLLQIARSFVPVESGTLKKSLAIKVKYYKNTDSIVGIVGPKKWFTLSGKAKFYAQGGQRIAHKYAHLAEYGRKAIINRKLLRFPDGSVASIKVQGSVIPAAKGKPFISKAAKIGGKRALKVMQQVIEAGL